MGDIQRETDENMEAFKRELPNLSAHRGKYFLMRGGKIINYYDTLQDAYSTGAAVYDDNMFSVVLLRGVKKAATKKTAKKKTSKIKASRKISKKKTSKKERETIATLDTTMMPRREVIPGIAPDLPDISNWKLAAEALKIRPFYTGAKSLPFSCLRATQMRIEPPIKKGGVAFIEVNDYFLAQECRGLSI